MGLLLAADRRHTVGRLRAMLLALASCLLAGACMQVPDSGPVRAGPQVASDEEPVLRYVPSGPRPGADPVTVINGYLQAMRAYPPDPGIVRRFLTPDARASWSPGAGTQIYIDRPEPEQVAPNMVTIETVLAARLDERGKWSSPPAGERGLRLRLRLEKHAGEWRIANPAEGLLLPEYDFERYYQAYSLYFFDPALRVLVPDQVFLPEGDQTATLLLGGLLRGPTEWLRGAVDSMLPRTGQADVSVPVGDDGVAQLQLGSAVRDLGSQERELLAAQLSWTLRQVPDVESIRVTVNGVPMPLGSESALTDVDAGADYDPADSAAAQTLYALRGDHVVTVDPFEARSARLPGLFGSGRLPLSAFAVERTGQTIAGVTGQGTTVVVGPVEGSRADVWFDGGRSLLGLQWDIHGLLWAVDRTPRGPRVYVMRDGASATVELRGGPPGDIQAFALARDGVRLAVVTGRGESSRLLVGRVRRPSGNTLRLAVDRWREIETAAPPLRSFGDVAWAGTTELTVAAEESPGSRQIFTVSVDGSGVEPSALFDLNVVSVTDVPVSDLPTVVGTRLGTLFVNLSDRWSELALRAPLEQPAYVE